MPSRSRLQTRPRFPAAEEHEFPRRQQQQISMSYQKKKAKTTIKCMDLTWAINMDLGGIFMYCPSLKSARNVCACDMLMYPYVLNTTFAKGFPGIM
ncbi:hypothetical protein BHE74_00024487 [Ensete ventricosum]|nr:hypothetical protein BHE74_00024487 [Ensete ventricosum]